MYLGEHMPSRYPNKIIFVQDHTLANLIAKLKLTTPLHPNKEKEKKIY